MTAVWSDHVPLLDREQDEERWSSPFAVESEVIGTDTRQHIEDTTAVPYRWVCSLEVDFRKPVTDDFGKGSGLLIGPRHVLTAAHNLFRDGKTNPGPVYVTPGRNGDEAPFGRVKVAHIYLLKTTLTTTGKVNKLEDYAVVKLEKDVGLQSFEAIGNRQLGWWGSDKLGHGTQLKPTSPTFLNGKNIAVTGYPGDRCGTTPCNPHACNCSKADQASTMWSGLGVVWAKAGNKLFLHTADTAPGQSGSPVWMRFNNGQRWVVGVHIDAAGPNHNMAVHLSSAVLANVHAWMKK